MEKGKRVWFTPKKLSGTLYNNGMVTAVNPDDTLDVDIGITNLVVRKKDLLLSQGLEDLNGTRVVSGRRQKSSLISTAA